MFIKSQQHSSKCLPRPGFRQYYFFYNTDTAFVACEDRLRSCKPSKRLIFHRLLLTIPSTFPDYKLVQINLTGKHVVGIFLIINGHRAGRRGRWWIIAQFSLYIRRLSWIDCSGTVYPGWSGSFVCRISSLPSRLWYSNNEVYL